MASPFPGMDPYIEFCGVWPGFHLKFINYWQEALNDLLPERYEAHNVHLDLQAVFELTYERGRYARSLDYSQPVPQTLAEETARWIQSRANSRSA